MIQQTKVRPPRPVLAALAVLTVGYVTVVAYVPWTDAVNITGSLIVTAIGAALIYGVWRGNPLAQGVVVLGMAGNLIVGFFEPAGIGRLRGRQHGGSPGRRRTAAGARVVTEVVRWPL